ncbi:thiamine pyrophosphate-binding protein [Idiomarina sp.]|uniref:thiamine pyrophosphate-binding protein n=1 Tax=Idiomarina sp. TaxID=1874361 RepID=UPI001D1EA93D|nr:thiamine pyrophosphate-binding protein [Idiomarina sp.]MCJ8317267.1 thiamine pyrophosphate-binding protein [Idiomarina sp.]NQZ16881.1 indolepyruvate decarboxylase [Idiomarina sp.]
MQFTDVLLDQLNKLGIKELFGIPGDFILPLLSDIQKRSDIPFHYLSHEPAITFCADAAARITNRPAAVFLTYGAGALNAVNAVAQAYEEHVPLIVIAGFPAQKEIDRGLHIHHQAKHTDSQSRVFEQVTCYQTRIDSPETATARLQNALSECQRQSRPVLIEVARDAFAYDAPALEDWPMPEMPVIELTSLNAQIKERLQKAKKPVILAGVDVRRFHASAALESFSEKTGIPIVTTFLGRSVINVQHPNYAGVFLDDSDSTAYQLLTDADLILSVGIIRTDSNFAAHNHLLHEEKLLDLQQNRCRVGKSQYHQVNLKTVLDSLTQASLPWFGRSGSKVSEPTVAEGKFTADHAIRVIHKTLESSENTVPFVTDVGDCLFASLLAQPSLCLAPAYYASMGYAVPAAYGIQAATGMRPMVLVGDGAFLMSGLELGHFQRHNYAPIVVLFNNKRWDMIQAFAPDLGCTDLTGWNYQKLSESMGCEYHSANNEEQLETAVENALKQTQKVSFIEVALAADARTERLDRFAYRFLNA